MFFNSCQFMDMYAENIMDHYRNPRHYGKLSEYSFKRHEVNTTCGDQVDVEVNVDDGILKDVAYIGEGCAISQAGASILFDELVGMETEEILKFGKDEVFEMMGIHITARRARCALLSLLAVQNALLELRGEKLRSFADLVV